MKVEVIQTPKVIYVKSLDEIFKNIQTRIPK